MSFAEAEGLEATGSAGDELRRLPLEQLVTGPEQPRHTIDPDGAAERLVASVRRLGVLTPLLVRSLPEGRFGILPGERRFRAAKEAGLAWVPCRVFEVEDEKALEVALAENLHREGLSDIDRCEALWELRRRKGLTWAALAVEVGLSLPRVKQIAGLKDLRPELVAAARARHVSGRKLLVLRTLPDDVQLAYLERMLREGWTAEELRGVLARERRSEPGNAAEDNEEGITRNTSSSIQVGAAPEEDPGMLEGVTRNTPLASACEPFGANSLAERERFTRSLAVIRECAAAGMRDEVIDGVKKLLRQLE